MQQSRVELEKGLLKTWVHNPDPIFSEEEQFFRRRLGLRDYLKAISELVGVKSDEEVADENVIDKTINSQIPAEIIYDDEFCFAYKEKVSLAPVHFLVVPKVKPGTV